MEFVLQVQIQSILSRFPNDFKRSEERALTALKRRFNPFLRITVQIQFTMCPNGTQIVLPLEKADRVTVGKSRISILLKGDILEKQSRLYCSFIFFVFFFFVLAAARILRSGVADWSYGQKMGRAVD
ncbi:hypothetical protein SUGI_0916720 [Cryptomeria japonica]|nr:hypothetical protein SUGI_0916720 [Cryptomeria japonica]